RRRFTDTFRPDTAAGPAGSVLLLPDTFTNNFHPSIAHDAVKVLREAGFAVTVPRRTVCCGLTWISTGQLRTAKRVLRRTVRELEPQLRAGTPVVVLEPSCATVFRRELPDLLRDDEDAHRLAKQTRTLAEQLSDWTPPRLGGHAVAQVHCHQHAVLGFDADTELIRRAGVELDDLDAGCCGMAGNFGFERGHYEVSQAVAEYDLLPRLRECSPDTILLADGFSCR